MPDRCQILAGCSCILLDNWHCHCSVIANASQEAQRLASETFDEIKGVFQGFCLDGFCIAAAARSRHHRLALVDSQSELRAGRQGPLLLKVVHVVA